MEMKLSKLVSIIRCGSSIIKIIDYSNNSIVYFESTINDFFDKDMNIIMKDSEVCAVDYKYGRYIIEVNNNDVDCFFDHGMYYRNPGVTISE